MKHAHYWLCPTPDGETCEAHCKYCPATKTLKNSMPSKEFTTDTHLSYSNREIFIGKRETLYQTVWGG